MSKTTQLTDKEVRIIDNIRRNDLGEIRVVKKDGEPSVLHLKPNPIKTDEITIKDILDVIERQDFADITVKKRNGKVVYVDEDLTIKL